MTLLSSASMLSEAEPGGRGFFLEQHALIHTLVDSFALGGLSEAQLRKAPPVGQNSLAFVLWHAARFEDVIVNTWLTGLPQVCDDIALARMRVRDRHVGTGMHAEEAASLGAAIDLAELGTYWSAVGIRTQAVVRALSADALAEVIDTDRLRASTPDAAHGNPRAPWLDQFFADHTVAWHLAFLNLHLSEHLLGEALAVRGQLGFPLGL